MDMTSQSVLDKADRQVLTSRERVQSLENQLAITGPDRIRLENQMEMAKVSLEQAILDVERCRINTPFDAWVTQKGVETGQHLSVGQSVGSIYRAGAFDIEVKIPMNDLAMVSGWRWIRIGAAGGGAVHGDLYTQTVERPRGQGQGRPGSDHPEPCPWWSKWTNQPLEDSITHAADRLKPGMFVTVRIQGRQVENVHRLPRYLVHDGDTVYLAADDQLSIQPVSILRSFKQTVLISGGLSDGDLVITTPLSGAVPGMRIRMKAED